MTDYLTISSCYYSLGCDGRAPTAPDTPGLILSQSPPSEQRGEERSLRTLHLVKSREQSSVLNKVSSLNSGIYGCFNNFRSIENV